jgi:hypothetical protein
MSDRHTSPTPWEFRECVDGMEHLCSDGDRVLVYHEGLDFKTVAANWDLVRAAVNSYGNHFADPLQAAEQDLLGEALDACSDAKQVLRNILDDVWLRARLHEFQSAEALVVAVEAHLCALLAKTKGNK